MHEPHTHAMPPPIFIETCSSTQDKIDITEAGTI